MSAFEPLYTADEMRQAEAGHDVAAMMERAGTAVAESLLRRWPDAQEIAVVCGKGSNGGDGRIAARVLEAAGRRATIVESGRPVPRADVVVDALFGTGLREAPRADAAAQIETMRGQVLSVDVPSGVDASTGEVPGVAVRAGATVTMHAPKVGLHVAPGRFHAGEVEVVDIGIGHVPTRRRLVTTQVLARIPARSAADNKYTAGAVLVVGGARGMTGAVRLAATAALRADAGYVAVAVPEESLGIVEATLVEPVKTTWDRLGDVAQRVGAVAVGPGLGRDDRARRVVREVVALGLPTVVDADALALLEPLGDAPAVVLTPHEGELAGMLGVEAAWVRAHRLAAVERARERYGALLLLKGADTIVGALVHSADAPQLATAGSGDVLTGILAAFLAKGVDPELAAAAATAAHAEAARLGPERGLVASDLVEALPDVLAGIS
ncbi:MAG: NAD(P)H-hydrate dehydratase [Pseudomonadota bacterium]